MRSRAHIHSLSLMLALACGAPAAAQNLPGGLARTFPLAVKPAAAAERLERALQQDKERGQVDSAAVIYRQVLALYEGGQATPATAARAQARLRWLAGSDVQVAEIASTRHAPGVLPTAVGGALRGAMELQLGQVRQPAPPDAVDRARRYRVERIAPVAAVSSEPEMLAAIGAAVNAVRRGLGLGGLLQYIEEERRRIRPRPVTAHEQYLAGLLHEKEFRDFGGALQRYRNVVQLNQSGGIATRLSERARLGAARAASHLSAEDGS